MNINIKNDLLSFSFLIEKMGRILSTPPWLENKCLCKKLLGRHTYQLSSLSPIWSLLVSAGWLTIDYWFLPCYFIFIFFWFIPASDYCSLAFWSAQCVSSCQILLVHLCLCSPSSCNVIELCQEESSWQKRWTSFAMRYIYNTLLAFDT